MKIPAKVGLFGEVVEASGLSVVFAALTLGRACARAGVEPSGLTRDDLRRVLPRIEKELETFLAPEELPARLAAIRVLAGL